MSERDKPYGHNESEWHYPTFKPKWLVRQPSENARYCVINGIAFEMMAGSFFGYFIDRITMEGDYLGETCWVEKYEEGKAVMADWENRPTQIPAQYEVEDIYGDDEGNPTVVARAKQARRRSSQVQRDKNAANMRAKRASVSA